jgi:hypothetical protein
MGLLCFYEDLKYYAACYCGLANPLNTMLGKVSISIVEK